MGSWVHGFMGSWVHGFMGSWVHGFIVHGFMGSWVHGWFIVHSSSLLSKLAFRFRASSDREMPTAGAPEAFGAAQRPGRPVPAPGIFSICFRPAPPPIWTAYSVGGGLSRRQRRVGPCFHGVTRNQIGLWGLIWTAVIVHSSWFMVHSSMVHEFMVHGS
jgi:hypothetical protein